jgi:hypothetical protein
MDNSRHLSAALGLALMVGAIATVITAIFLYFLPVPHIGGEFGGFLTAYADTIPLAAGTFFTGGTLFFFG